VLGGASRPVKGPTGAVGVATGAVEGTTGAVEGATGAVEGATGAVEGATGAVEGTTGALLLPVLRRLLWLLISVASVQLATGEVTQGCEGELDSNSMS